MKSTLSKLALRLVINILLKDMRYVYLNAKVEDIQRTVKNAVRRNTAIYNLLKETHPEQTHHERNIIVHAIQALRIRTGEAAEVEALISNVEK